MTAQVVYLALARILVGSQRASSPFSIPAAITPRGRVESTCPQARRLNLHYISLQNTEQNYQAYLEVSETTPFGPACPSPPRSYSFLSRKFGAHISSWLSLLNDSSSAPATVPVANNGSEAVGDHANVEVLWISLSFMIVGGEYDGADVEFH